MRDLASGLETGSPDYGPDAQQPYVRLAYAEMTFDLLANKRQRALLLVTIAVPPALRRQGLATRIVTFLEERAVYESVRFVVGPIMEAEDGSAHMQTLCRQRGYRPAVPWSMFRPYRIDNTQWPTPRIIWADEADCEVVPDVT